MTKRTWKPLDVMGLRLYKVVASWPDTTKPSGVRRQHTVVAANAPRDAAAIVSVQYDNLPAEHRPTCYGQALNVCQPEEWFTQEPSADPMTCKHGRTDHLCGGSGSGWREDVYLCMDCGQIEVHVVRGKEVSRVTFGLNCDRHLLAAAKYYRSLAMQEDAVKRCGKEFTC